MKRKVIKIVGVTFILFALIISIVPTATDGELPPPYGQSMPATSQISSNV